MPTFNLSLKPAQLEFIAKPGSTIIQAYTITNNTDQSLLLSSDVRPWLPQGSDGLVTYDRVPQNQDFQFSLNNSDLSLGQTFLLKANESRQLVLKIKHQAEGKLGDSYFTFFINQSPNGSPDDGETRTTSIGQFGSHLLLSISNNENVPSLAKINNFHSSPKFVDILFPNIIFQANIENLSQYFFKIKGNLVVTKNNLSISQVELSPDNVLAHHQRQVTQTLSPPYWPGAYTATLTLDPSLSTKQSSINFYVLPISPLIFVVLLGLIYFIFRRRQVTH